MEANYVISGENYKHILSTFYIFYLLPGLFKNLFSNQ
jgi:hypothetical protein